MSRRRRNGRRQRDRHRQHVVVPEFGSDGTPAASRREQVVDASHATPATESVNVAEDAAVQADKQVAFYQTSIEAFLENRMERDKSLLTLSTAGLGLVVTLWTTIGVATVVELGLGVAAAVAFMAAIYSLLEVFKENANYFEALTTKQDFVRPHDRLVRLDRRADKAFYAGLLFAFAGAVTVTYRKYLEKPDPPIKTETMSETSNDKTTPPGVVTGATPSPAGVDSLKPLNEGVQGFHNLVPRIDTGSAQNFHNLAPQNPAQPVAPPPATTAPQGTATPGATNQTTSDTTKRP
jgi:hypothetical protein